MKHRTRLTVILSLVVSTSVVLALLAEAFAQDQRSAKRFPPYPDVWGIELPFPRSGDRNAISDIFYSADGDITFITHRHTDEFRRPDGTCCEVALQYGQVELFKGSSTNLTSEQMAAFSERNHRYRASLLRRRIVTKSGRVVEAQIRGHNCFSYGANRIVLRMADGSVLRDLHLYYLFDKMINFLQKPDCEPAGGASFVRMRVQEMAPILIPLEDDTFLVYDSGGNTAIRFDADFMTKFPLNERVYVVERNAFDALYEESTRERTLNQAVHDRLLRLLLETKHESKESDR